MTEVATRDEVVPNGAGESALVLWAYEAQQAARIAVSLAKTSFVPQSFRGKPEDITAAILAGNELGLQPMATLRSMDIIQGTPALRAHAMRGLVQSRGHKIWLVEQTATRVIMRGQRREADGSFGEVQESKWTLDRADKLGLAGKQEWKKQPQTMLTARATGEICRLIAADVLYAMPYAVEELESDLPESIVGRKPRKTAQRKPLPTVEPEFEAPDEPEPELEANGDTPPPLETWDEKWPDVAEPADAPNEEAP